MDRVKKLKVKKTDGSFTDYIPIGTDAQYVDMNNGNNIEETIGNIDIQNNGNIASQLNTKPYYFNSITDMKLNSKFKDGDCAITLGYNKINDGSSLLYKIRKKIDTDVIDNINTVGLSNENLVAERIRESHTKLILSQIIDTSPYGQVIHGYENKSIQCFTMFENTLIACLSGDSSNNGALVKINLLTGKLTDKIENLNIGHANDVTYCDKDGFIYIACGGGTNGLSKISVFNTDLQFIKDIDFTNIGSGHPYGIAYNNYKNVFYVLLGNQLCELNYALDTILKTSNLVSQNKDYVQQSIYFDGNYIYNIVNIINDISSYSSYNKVDVYDINSLEYYTSQKISILGEIESGCYYQGFVYYIKLTQGMGIVCQASNYENEKTLNYINENIFSGFTFPNISGNKNIYVNSNYTDFYIDGTESKPFNNLYVALSFVYINPIDLTIYLTGDFSTKNIYLQYYNKRLNFIGTSEVDRAKIGGIYISNCADTRFKNLEIVKRSDIENNLISAYYTKYLYLNNIVFNGKGTENTALKLIDTFCNGSALYFNSDVTIPNEMIYVSENSGFVFSGIIEINNNGKLQANSDLIKLPYRPQKAFWNSSGAWKCNIIGGGITFNLSDLKTEGNYRVEGGNTCSDAPAGYTTNAFRVRVENINDNIIYKFIPFKTNKLFIGILAEEQSFITWKEIL